MKKTDIAIPSSVKSLEQEKEEIEALILEGFSQLAKAQELYQKLGREDQDPFFVTGTTKFGFSFLKDDAKNEIKRSFAILKKNLWKKVLRTVGLKDYLTEEKYHAMIRQIEKGEIFDFTQSNVFEVIKDLSNDIPDYTHELIQECFKRINIEKKFKTNKKYKVGRLIKFYNLFWGQYNIGNLSNDGLFFLVNLEKCFSFLEGKGVPRYPNNIETVLKKAAGLDESHNFLHSGSCNGKYFRVKWFKNGNVHLEIKDEYETLLKEFNKIGAEGINKIGLKEKKNESMQKK